MRRLCGVADLFSETTMSLHVCSHSPAWEGVVCRAEGGYTCGGKFVQCGRQHRCKDHIQKIYLRDVLHFQLSFSCTFSSDESHRF
jgi:hypothetical protein